MIYIFHAISNFFFQLECSELYQQPKFFLLSLKKLLTISITSAPINID